MLFLIRTKNLCKTYNGGEIKTPAVRNVSLKIQAGEFVSIVGPSGSGKSTLMQLLSFLDRPTAGEYYFLGKNAKNFSDDELAELRNKKIGFIFQTFNLLPRTTVFENVEIPLLYSENIPTKKETEEKIKKSLQEVFLSHRINYYSNQLSGGEKQRVAIARALINDPEIIFADEPTGNLDSRSGNQIMQILQKLNHEGKTIILVTHERSTAHHGKRIIKITDGEIIEDNPVLERILADKKDLIK